MLSSPLWFPLALVLLSVLLMAVQVGIYIGMRIMGWYMRWMLHLMDMINPSASPSLEEGSTTRVTSVGGNLQKSALPPAGSTLPTSAVVIPPEAGMTRTHSPIDALAAALNQQPIPTPPKVLSLHTGQYIRWTPGLCGYHYGPDGINWYWQETSYPL